MPNRSANEHYLQTIVLAAPPARLRLMLLDRAVSMVEMINEGRRRAPDRLTDERTLSLRDILGELLSGVKADSNDLATRVADLYVFLLQELTRAEQEPGVERIESIGNILRIEQETWRQVCEAQVRRHIPAPAFSSGTSAETTPTAGSLNLQA